jgi:N-acyl-D-amino-acid deacylase
MHAFLIRGATVVDGSGGPPVQADVALEGERIKACEARIAAAGREVIDGDGLVLSPGFIDIHSHTDMTIFHHPLAESKVLQGVTLDVTGNCGIGPFPVNPDRKGMLFDYLRVLDFLAPPGGVDWTDFTQYADRLDRLGLGINLAPLAAHGALRIAAMGSENRPPTPDELGHMEALLDTLLAEGAWGMSTGLIYPPGSYARTEELIALATVLSRHGALYTSHIRGESATLDQALDEAIRIGRESGVRVEVSHLKALGKAYWGRGKEALDRLMRARAEGIDIGADQYPYEATSTSLTALVPQWAHEGGVAELLGRLASPDLRARLREEILREMEVRGGPERVRVAGVGSDRNRGLSGRNLSQIALERRESPEETVIGLLLEEKGVVSAVYFSLSDEDVAAIMTSDQVAVGSDGSGFNAARAEGQVIHPRNYGTFARVLGLYARERGLLSLPAAIFKMTGLPARRLGLRDRGQLRPGWAADLVLFDPDRVRDRSSFESPHQYATGVAHVFVNGCPVVRNGHLTGETPGRVLRRALT